MKEAYNPVNILTNTATSDRRRPLDEAMTLAREDVCEWLTTLLSTTITPSSFLSSLESGDLLGQLAGCISTAAHSSLSSSLPVWSCRIRRRSLYASGEGAAGGYWQARDRVTKFLSWCRQCGLRDEVLFECEGLVSHSDERTVLVTLLEIARVGGQQGLPVPQLVRIQADIEADQTTFQDSSLNVSNCSSIASFETTSAADDIRKAFTPLNKGNPLPSPHTQRTALSSNRKTSRIPVKTSLHHNRPSLLQPPTAQSPRSPSSSLLHGSLTGRITKQRHLHLHPPVRRRSSGRLQGRKSQDLLTDLDRMVTQVVAECSCSPEKRFSVVRIKSGRYRFGSRGFYARAFRGYVVLRVGGGWETLRDFLNRRDPCRLGVKGVLPLV